MRVLVIYDSFFGNTEQIAQAIGRALDPQGDVRVRRVSSVRPEDVAGVEMLIVGSPTRGFRATPAIMNLLKALPRDSLRGVKVAAFDTRIGEADINSRVLRFFVGTGGYASKHIMGGLTKKGGQPGSPAEGFLVEGTEGPLKDGELERASDWAKGLAEG
jgi:flavodoxin I